MKSSPKLSKTKKEAKAETTYLEIKRPRLRLINGEVSPNDYDKFIISHLDLYHDKSFMKLVNAFEKAVEVNKTLVISTPVKYVMVISYYSDLTCTIDAEAYNKKGEILDEEDVVANLPEVKKILAEQKVKVSKARKDIVDYFEAKCKENNVKAHNNLISHLFEYIEQII